MILEKSKLVKMLLETLSNILSLTAYGSLSGTENFSAGTDRKAKAPLMLFDAKIAKKGIDPMMPNFAKASNISECAPTPNSCSPSK